VRYPLPATSFPEGTPLRAFFRWNERRLRPDRRFILAQDIHWLRTRFPGTTGQALATAHLTIQPAFSWRGVRQLSRRRVERLLAGPERAHDRPTAAARVVVDRLAASIGASDPAAHAAVFEAFEALEAAVDLQALTAVRPRWQPAAFRPVPANILVIKLSALGDFIQALGPAAAIRQHHARDKITLLTTEPYADFARQTGLFDTIMIDRRPRAWDIARWLDLRRRLRAARFDRVYDLQTSDRSSLYARLFWPGRMPAWSGIARCCSHPHANLGRDPQHTIDKQAEQLLMAGIYPTPLPSLPELGLALPARLGDDRRFGLLIPGSSPHRPDKRWPAERFGALAGHLNAAGLVPVVIGTAAEADLGRIITALCPEALDLTGKTDLPSLAGLARQAALTIGNDTGASHIAAAAGHPVVVLFSQASDPARCAPRGNRVTVLAAPNLVELTLEPVLAAARDLTGIATPLSRPPGFTAAAPLHYTSGDNIQ
jgi:ADP-heptose:LPS heptosyltransferase